MKTFNKLTTDEKNIHSKKCEVNFNFELLNAIFKFVFKNLNDPSVLQAINDLLVSFLHNLDSIISKYLSTYENDNKENTSSSSN